MNMAISTAADLKEILCLFSKTTYNILNIFLFCGIIVIIIIWGGQIYENEYRDTDLYAEGGT